MGILRRKPSKYLLALEQRIDTLEQLRTSMAIRILSLEEAVAAFKEGKRGK